MTGKTPKTCLECRGSLPARPIIARFARRSYGHSACPRCGITFDSNVNDVADVELSAVEIGAIADEGRYRELFVETSRIADDEGRIYARFDWKDDTGLKQGIAAHVLAAIEAHHGPPAVVVDVGCGDGFTSEVIAGRFPECSVVAIDPSPLVLRLDRHPRITPVRGTLQSARLPEGSADVVCVIGNWMLHLDPFSTAAEARRVMKEEGILILDFKNVRSLARRLARLVLRTPLTRLGGKRYLQRTFVNMRYGMHKAFVRRQLEAMGFEILEMRSKPPRLLEFKNESAYQAGLAGLVWRLLDRLDGLRDERAWVQAVLRKDVDREPRPANRNVEPRRAVTDRPSPR